MADTTYERATPFATLLAWVEHGGGRVTPAQAQQEVELRGLFAVEDVAAGDEIAQIPAPLLITPEKARESRIGARIEGLAGAVSPFGLLAALLLEVRRDGGFCKPYVDMLPEGFEGHPVFSWVDLPKSSSMSLTVSHATAVRKAAQADWKQLAPVLEGEEAWSSDDFWWAYCSVRTRVFQFADDQGGIRTALIPIADMMNHRSVPDAIYVEDEDGYRIVAQKAIPRGAELTASYGDLGNAKLLAVYGFCLAHNEFDQAMIATPSAAFIVTASHAHESTRKMFAQLRRASLAVQPDAAAPVGEQPIDLTNELAALTLLRNSTEWTLIQWADRLVVHETLRPDADRLDPLSLNVLTAELGEVQVLKHYLKLSAAAIEFLQSPASATIEQHRQAIGDDDYFEALVSALRPSA